MTATSIFDPLRYKASIRAEWRTAAAGWRAWLEVLEAEDAGTAVSQTLVELAGIGPGGCGAGRGGRLRGARPDRRAGGGTRRVCGLHRTSPPRCSRSAANAAAEGLDHVQFLECDAEELALEEASLDAVLSRQGLQFLPDVAGVLARLHAFLKPGGRLAAAVWGPPGAVQFAAPVPLIRPSSNSRQGDPGVGALQHRRWPGPAQEPSGLGDREKIRRHWPLVAGQSRLKQTRAQASSTNAKNRPEPRSHRIARRR
jgi:SAM-dependent methyltransferase